MLFTRAKANSREKEEEGGSWYAKWNKGGTDGKVDSPPEPVIASRQSGRRRGRVRVVAWRG